MIQILKNKIKIDLVQTKNHYIEERIDRMESEFIRWRNVNFLQSNAYHYKLPDLRAVLFMLDLVWMLFLRPPSD